MISPLLSGAPFLYLNVSRGYEKGTLDSNGAIPFFELTPFIDLISQYLPLIPVIIKTNVVDFLCKADCINSAGNLMNSYVQAKNHRTHHNNCLCLPNPFLSNVLSEPPPPPPPKKNQVSEVCRLNQKRTL